jgi:hypothetical protein
VPQSTLPQSLSRFPGNLNGFDAVIDRTNVDNTKYTEARKALMWPNRKAEGRDRKDVGQSARLKRSAAMPRDICAAGELKWLG